MGGQWIGESASLRGCESLQSVRPQGCKLLTLELFLFRGTRDPRARAWHFFLSPALSWPLYTQQHSQEDYLGKRITCICASSRFKSKTPAAKFTLSFAAFCLFRQHVSTSGMIALLPGCPRLRHLAPVWKQACPLTRSVSSGSFPSGFLCNHISLMAFNKSLSAFLCVFIGCFLIGMKVFLSLFWLSCLFENNRSPCKFAWGRAWICYKYTQLSHTSREKVKPRLLGERLRKLSGSKEKACYYLVSYCYSYWMSKRVHFCLMSSLPSPLQFPLLLFAQRAINGLPCLGVKSFQALALKLIHTPVLPSRSPAWRVWPVALVRVHSWTLAHARRSGPFTVNIVMGTPSSAQTALLREEGWTCAERWFKNIALYSP